MPELKSNREQSRDSMIRYGAWWPDADYLLTVRGVPEQTFALAPLNDDLIGIGFHTRPVAYRTSGTLAQTQARLAVSRMAVTRNTQCSPSVAAMTPPESGPSDWPRNIADAVTP